MRLFLALATAVILSAAQAAAQVGIGFGDVPHDTSDPIEVTADSLTVNRETGNAVFSGNVIIVQGELRMAAGEVTVIYDPAGDGTGVQQVIATGGVLVTRGADAAEGERMDYVVDTSLMTLTGSVLVTQGPTAIAGDRMVVNMATGDGTVEGRVRTVLQPSEEGQ